MENLLNRKNKSTKIKSIPIMKKSNIYKMLGVLGMLFAFSGSGFSQSATMGTAQNPAGGSMKQVSASQTSGVRADDPSFIQATKAEVKTTVAPEFVPSLTNKVVEMNFSGLDQKKANQIEALAKAAGYTAVKVDFTTGNIKVAGPVSSTTEESVKAWIKNNLILETKTH
jgi:hypothetical protein